MRTRWKIIPNRVWVAGIIAVVGFTACNDSASGSTSKTTSVDSSVSANADTVKSTAIKPAKKRKTSVAFDANSSTRIERDKEGVYNRAESMPEFPGGQQALAAYVENHLNYPQQAVDDNTTGTVRVSFIIDEKGKVIKPKVAGDKKVGNGLDEEALKVVEQMPAWKPGKVKGKNVKTRLELPITFQLEA